MNPAQLEQAVRFCAAPDGTRIAFGTMGSGPPMVKAANWLSHLEFDLQSPVWQHWLRELAREHTLIRYDERGCGLSDWDVQNNSHAAWVTDLEAVVDAAGLGRFPLIGISQGGPVAIEYAVRHPERVTHLILYGTYARGWRKRGASESEIAEREAMITLSEAGWGRDLPVYRDIFTKTFIPDASEEQRDWFNELQRITCSPANAVRLQQALGDIDVTHLLPQIKVPTLVLHARGDLRCPFDEGKIVAAGIPGCRFVSLDSRNHLLLEQEPAWHEFLREVRGFLGVDTRETAPIVQMRSPIARLKDRKIVQWALGYLTVAWVLLQVLGEVQEPWDLPRWVMRAAQIVLLHGLLITVVLAWYHGKPGKQRVTASEIGILVLVLILMGSLLVLV